MKYTRLREMEDYILKKESVSLDELCEVFNKSKNTIRRDVSELLKTGSVEKIYGGVRAVKPPAGVLLSYDERHAKHPEEKAVIGALAAQFVENNDVIFIDAGTTPINIIPHLAGKSGITILTNNLFAISLCMEYPNFTTISFGGQLNTQMAAFSSDFCDLDNVHNFNISKAFMAATGISTVRGVTSSSPGELAIKKSIVDISDTCYLMADSSKFDHIALLTYADLSRFQYVITEKEPSDEYKTYFDEHGITLVTG